MNRLVLCVVAALAFGCGDSRHYSNLVLRVHVLKNGAPATNVAMKVTVVPNDGAHSSGRESAPFELTEPFVLPCERHKLEDCAHGTAGPDSSGVAAVVIRAPEPRKDYEEDDEHPEREAHPGRYAKSLKISITQGSTTTEQVFHFQKDDPLWKFHRDGAPDDAYACAFNADYANCTVELPVTLP